jgi:hypothetical protein
LFHRAVSVASHLSAAMSVSLEPKRLVWQQNFVGVVVQGSDITLATQLRGAMDHVFDTTVE